MILLAGIPSEPPMRMVADALDALGQPYIFWNQRHIAACRMDFEISGGTIDGVLTLGDIQISLSEIQGVYVRIMDDGQLPELKHLPPNSPQRLHSRVQHDALLLWLDITPARVANRPSANGSNGSKPWQTRLIEATGLPTPATLVTNEPSSVRDFQRTHGDLIYKSASGFRSVVRHFNHDDESRLESIRWCPVQFQRRVPGHDVRVHVVGREIHATRIRSTATDYRYASREGTETQLEIYDLPPDLSAACHRLSGELNLPFAGIDLRIQDDATAWCFEVNPCPGFSYYQSHTAQPIATALARYLADISL